MQKGGSFAQSMPFAYPNSMPGYAKGMPTLCEGYAKGMRRLLREQIENVFYLKRLLGFLASLR